MLGEATKEPAKTEQAPAGEKPAAPAALELKLPEGVTVPEAELAAYKELALKQGLDAPKAQALLEHFVAVDRAREQALAETVAKQEQAWTASLKADPDLGGQKWDATVQSVRRAIDYVGKPAAQMLVQAGLGSHPDVVRALVKLGRGLAEDRIAGTSQAPGVKQPKTFAEVAYPTMQKHTEKEN